MPSIPLVIIPTYNEINNISSLIETILELPIFCDILIVDDNSPDGTGKWIAQKMLSERRLHLILREKKNGLGRAYIEGFQWGLSQDYEIIIQLDADFSHNPSDIPSLLSELSSADLVIGSRYINGIRVMNWPLRRLLLSKFASLYVRLITGMPVHDPTGGFKCWKASLLKKIDLSSIVSNGYSFQIETNYRAWQHGFTVKEIPIVFTERRDGKSKISFHIIFEAFCIVWQLLYKKCFSRIPKINK